MTAVGDDIWQLSLPVVAGTPLLQALQDKACDIDVMEDAASKGAVWWQKQSATGVTGKLKRLRQLAGVAPTDGLLQVNYNAQVLAQSAATPECVLMQHNYSIWNKPAGLFSQGSRWGDHCSIARCVELQLSRPTYLVHRLDRAASGLILLAHTRPAVQKLAQLFADRQVYKRYCVHVHGELLQPLPVDITTPIAGKSAVSRILHSDVAADKQRSCLQLTIDTGRKHQIRSHLASIGFPVVGDRLFDRQREHHDDLQLRACELRFSCPYTHDPITASLPLL